MAYDPRLAEKRQELLAAVERVVWPIATLATQGKYERTRTLELDEAGLAAAITSALGCAVSNVSLRCVARPFSDADTALVFGELVFFTDSLAMKLADACRESLRVRGRELYGEGCWEARKNEIWSEIKHNVGQQLGMTFWDDPWQAPRNGPGENLLTFLFHFIALADVGDEEGVRKLTPLGRLMSYAIPLGEMKNDPGHWVVVLAPSPAQRG